MKFDYNSLKTGIYEMPKEHDFAVKVALRVVEPSIENSGYEDVKINRSIEIPKKTPEYPKILTNI